MKTNPKYEYGKIDRTSGMGGFLNPPTHPEHTISVCSLRGDTFSMSLSAAAKDKHLDPSTRGSASGILKAWNPPAIDSAEVQDWICEVLGYFEGCYQAANGSWNASELVIDNERDAVANADTHAGVNLIRKYYPSFVPAAAHFAGAYWGKKPEGKQ